VFNFIQTRIHQRAHAWSGRYHGFTVREARQLEDRRTNGQENQEIENSKKGRKESSKEGEKARYTGRQVGYPAEALIFFLDTPMPAAGLAAVWVFPIMPDL
jgi:predicted SPOUT superfamily RNA methylase MTH1